MTISNIGTVASWDCSGNRSGAVWVAPTASTGYNGSFNRSGSGTVYCSATLNVNPPANCTFNGNTVNNGSSVTAYQAATAPFGNSCVSKTRTCNNGTLSGSYQYSSCSVTPAANCTFNGSPVAHGSSVTAYQNSVVPYGSSCISQSRTCTNGTLSGTFTNASCTVAPPADCTLGGDTVPHGDSITAYRSSWVPNGSSCSTLSETRTCNDGTLSGTYGYTSCVMGPPATCALSGFAWSENIGWLSLSCQDLGTCGSSNYKIAAADDGSVFGYAWSENIGWVSANPSDLVGCPSGDCEAKLVSNELTGWLRVLSGGTSQSGGWDGFIRLNGSSPDYGVTVNDGGGLTGYGWGDKVVGWVDFSQAQSSCTPCQSSYVCEGQTIVHNSAQCAITEVTTCSSPSFCAPGSAVCLVPGAKFNEGASGSGLTGHLQIRPLIVATGAKAKVYWNVSNVQSCTVSGSNGDHWLGSSSGTSGTSTSPIMGKTTFSLHCVALQGASPATIDETAAVSVAPTWQEK